MVTFLTAGSTPSIATCAGAANPDEPLHGDCLVLEKLVWKEGLMGQLLTPRNAYPAVVTMPVGVYLIGGTKAEKKTEFLQADTMKWQRGPALPVPMDGPCAVKISESSFLVIQNKHIIEFDTTSAGLKSDEGWQDMRKYPELTSARRTWPGCAKLDNKVIISGGGWMDSQSTRKAYRSTEILDLTTRTLSIGGEMKEARRAFHILNINNKLIAIGGKERSGVASPASNSVEEWDPSMSSWSKSKTTLVEERSNFGALVVFQELVC